jgi:hypothetical protein
VRSVARSSFLSLVRSDELERSSERDDPQPRNRHAEEEDNDKHDL